MKKFVLLLAMVFVLGFGTICSAASNASILGNEEKVVDKFLSALDKNNGAYEEIASNFTPGLQKKIDAVAMHNLRSQIADNFGTLKEKKLVTLEKFDQNYQKIHYS